MTTEEIKAAFRVVTLLGEAIREAGPDGIPSEMLYSAMMTIGMDLNAYHRAIDLLKNQGIVREENHKLYSLI